MNNKFEVIFCVVNAGFSDEVMFAARKAGAGGGTIIKGRGTAPVEAEETFKITVQPEKEIVIILVPETIKDDVLRSIYDSAGLSSEGQGIAFSLPIERAVGLTGFGEDKAPVKEAPKKKTP
jgi:nitrogen regulatory protein PII